MWRAWRTFLLNLKADDGDRLDMRDRGPDPTSMAAAVQGRNAGVTVDMSRQSGRWPGRSVTGGGLIDGDDIGGDGDGMGDLPYRHAVYDVELGGRMVSKYGRGGGGGSMVDMSRQTDRFAPDNDGAGGGAEGEDGATYREGEALLLSPHHVTNRGRPRTVASIDMSRQSERFPSTAVEDAMEVRLFMSLYEGCAY